MLSSFKFTTQAISFLTETAQGLQAFSSDSAIPPPRHERSLQQLNLFKSAEVAASVPITPCLNCGSTQARRIAGKGPHFAGLRCVNCDRFLKWLPSPKPELSSNEGGQQ